MRRITISLLGPFQVTADGVLLTSFGYAKVRALLGYLAVERQRPHPRAELATLLWPEQSEHNARNSLSQALTTLRTAFGAKAGERSLLLSDVNTVQLDPDCEVRVDASEMAAVLRQSEAHAHRSWRSCAACAERLHSALELYRGDFLADVAIPDSAVFEEWAIRHREHFRQRALSTLERLVERAQWRGAYAEAVGYAQHLVALDPLLEANQRTLMRLFALNGEVAAALAQYGQLHNLLARELAEEPEDATIDLADQIRRGETARLRPPAPPFVVPRPPTPIVGRGAEMEAFCARVRAPDTRLLTLTGAGGVGKTRLALEAAHALRYEFEDGIYFVELARLKEAVVVGDAIARVLGVPERPRHPVEATLREYLRPKHLLLILDNFEHVGAAAPLVGELLAASPALTVLVTSRVPLRVRAEQQFGLEALAEADAVRLFVERAQAAGANLAAHEANSAMNAAICQRLDRLPLAIELIAVRARTLAPRDLLAQLERPLVALPHGPRDAPARHQSLRETIQWSYALLDAEEQRVFRHLGVFAGGCSAEAAQAILDTSNAVLPVLETLVQASLAQQVNGDHTRVVLLETIREFAQEQLARCSEAATAQQRHAEYMLDLLTHADAKLTTPERPVWLERFDRDHCNALAALWWCSVAGRIETGLRLCAALGTYWTERGLSSLGLRWLDGLLTRAGDSVPLQARRAALNTAESMSLIQIDRPTARSRFEHSL